MSVVTPEHVSDRLTQSIAWRNKELHALLLQIKRAKNLEHQTVYLRSGVTVLYAHWEGFIRDSANVYLEFVINQRLKFDELTDPFKAAILQRALVGQEAIQNIEKYIDLLPKLFSDISNSKIPRRYEVNTKSNLTSKVLREITISLGLDYTEYKTKEKIIDKMLVDLRNKIAHGRDSYPTYLDFISTFDEVVSMMRLFKNQIENAAILGDYKI